MPGGNGRDVTKLNVFESGIECCSGAAAEFDNTGRGGFRRSAKFNRVGLLMKPSILRYQRKCLLLPYPSSEAGKFNGTRRIDGDEYVKRLKGRLGPKDTYMTTRKITAAQVSDSSVFERLSLRMDCDPRTRSCLMPYCGRSFDSLQVLAWHMSYAHQDLSRTDEQSSLCYLCGYQMQTAKGKNAHLTAKHRSVALRHNVQCLEQRDAVIAPGAPAAERLNYSISDMELIEVPLADSVVLVVRRS